MKKLILIQLSVLMLIIFTAATSGTVSSDEELISDLMKTRIDILSYYYGGKMDFEDARNNMAKITKESLFKEDIAMMEGFANTEVEQITDYSLEILSCKRISFGIIQGEARVRWVMHGRDGYWETEENYYFTAESDAENVKLTQLKKL